MAIPLGATYPVPWMCCSGGTYQLVIPVLVPAIHVVHSPRVRTESCDITYRGTYGYVPMVRTTGTTRYAYVRTGTYMWTPSYQNGTHVVL